MYPDFKELLSELNDHKVKYLVVGAYAVGQYAQAGQEILVMWMLCMLDLGHRLINRIQIRDEASLTRAR